LGVSDVCYSHVFDKVMNHILLITLFICLCCSSQAAFGQAREKLVLESGTESYDLGPHLYLFIDSAAESSLQQVVGKHGLFKKNTKSIPNFSAFRGAVWGSIYLHAKDSDDWWMAFDDSNIENIELWLLDEYGQQLKAYQSGFIKPYGSRELESNLYYVELELEKGKSYQLLFRCQTDRQMKLQARIATLQHITEDSHKLDIVQGIYFGIILVMILYNLFVFFSVRDKAYLYYVLFVASMGLFIGNWNGYAAEFLWRDHYWINKYATSIALMAAITGTLFSLVFLRIKHNAPKLYWPMHGYIVLAALVILVNISTDLFLETSAATKILIFFNAVGLLALGVYLYKKGVTSAKFYSLAWSMMLAGIILNLLKDTGLIPTNSLSIWSMQAGSAIEILLFSFALADRINQYRKEKEDAQQVAMQSLQENEKLVREQNEVLEKKVTERTHQLSEAVEELNQTNEELHSTVEQVQEQNLIIQRKNHAITASINYAQRIQQAMLPLSEELQKGLKEYMLYFKPRDIVSGDFYWCHTEGDKTVIAAVDCTGHGVPGAFMSLLGSEMLHESVTVKKITSPSAILNALHKGVKKQLRQEDTQNRDGMDAALCTIDHTTKTLAFAGAKNPLVCIKDGEITLLQGDRLSIGGRVKNTQREFSTKSVSFDEHTTFYIFSDGLQDQFGGENRRKFGIARLKKLLVSIYRMPLHEQQEVLSVEMERWIEQAGERQIDDMLLIGFRPGAMGEKVQEKLPRTEVPHAIGGKS